MNRDKDFHRFALCVEYCGSEFSGWQRQRNAPSVQQTLEMALSKLDPGRPTVTGAGRTDSGVHATGQVAHVDLERRWNPFRLREAANAKLRPASIAVLKVSEVDRQFSARTSAVMREYRYKITNRRAPRAVGFKLAWHVRSRLDCGAMMNGARRLTGKHDFTTFRAAQCQAHSPVKTLEGIEIHTVELPFGSEIAITFRARSFLHRQVRSIVGTLVKVGEGAWRPEEVTVALKARSRDACGPVAPAHGLYLSNVKYRPDPFDRDFRNG